jgi:peptidyl-dipeptidase A
MWKRTFLTSIAVVMILGGGPDGLLAQQSGDKDQMMSEARAFLDNYQKELAKLEIAASLAAWKAANTGKKEDFDASAETSLALRKFHSDTETYRRLKKYMAVRNDLPVKEGRALELCELAYRRNQLPADLLERMVELSTEIERMFNTFRAEIDGKKLSNNDLLKMLREETDTARREQIWQALKQVGGAVSPKLIELAKLRNQAAGKLGFDNFWDMQIRFQEHNPKQLLAIFDELQRLTGEPFARMKRKMDGELAERFGVEPAEMMPWHYDNPFFQAAPPSASVNLDEFYKDKAKEDIVEIARVFFDDVGLPIEDIIARSDLYEREGKDQHAFCISINRAEDVRTLCNIKPTAEWMDTMLHEEGHAVYDILIDRALPYNIREPSHIFTTEGVAMLFGALAKTPAWMVEYAGADKDRVNQLSEAIYEQRRREQLIFARWTMVMLSFEKALYEDPDQDLNRLWWDYVEKFQMLNRPADRDKPDWAAKPHFTIAPVYYHNYMLGELFAAQLRGVLAELAGHEGPTAELSFNGRKEFGDFLKRKVFAPGSTRPWPEFVRRATGNRLSAKCFAAEVR